MKKILHIISSANPEGGGPIEAIKQMGSIHPQYGHIVEVLTLDAPDADFLADFPLKVHALGGATKGYQYSSLFTPWLLRNAVHYEAIIINGLWQYHSFGTWRALKDQNIPYYVFTHGMLDPWFKETYPLKHLKKWLYWPWAEYRVLKDATSVFFTSCILLSKMCASGGKWIGRYDLLIYLNAQRYCNPPKPAEARLRDFDSHRKLIRSKF